MLKRCLDVAGSAVGLVLAGPLIGVLMLLIRRDSEGPGLFSQERVGRDGKSFVCHKLRTMRSGTAEVPTHQASSEAITQLGRTLRRTKLDELPQLWNVLRGDMSLVGPRPSLPSQTRLVEERRQRGVLVLRPGITGLAQVRGIDMRDPVQLAEIDAEYRDTRSLAGDVAILWRTLFG